MAAVPGPLVRAGPGNTTLKEAGTIQHAPFLHLGGGYPSLSRDIRRNLRQARRRLAEDNVRMVIRYDTGPAAVAGLLEEITAAWIARNVSAVRPCDLGAWRDICDTADEAATLRLDGHLAAWVLAVRDKPAYRVLAGQMAPGWERYRPGRLLEADLLRRVLADRAPSRRRGLPDARYMYIDWGSGLHPETLIAVS